MRVNKSLIARLPVLLRKTGRALRKLILSKDLLVFLLFLSLAFFFWFSQTMSKSYEMQLQFQVNLREAPYGMRITQQVTSPLRVNVSGKGTVLWLFKLKGYPTINLDANIFQQGSGYASLPTSYLIDSLELLIPQTLTVRQIIPDSLSYYFAKESVVRLPIVHNGRVSGANQYFIESVEFMPDCVTVRAPQSVADTLSAVFTELTDITVLSDTTRIDVALMPLESVISEQNTVLMTVICSQFTEKSLDIQIKGQNCPFGKTLKTFPSKVKVTFWVRMSDFEKVTESDFRVEIDYNDLKESTSDKAELIVSKKPYNIQRLRLSPVSVDYLIEESK